MISPTAKIVILLLTIIQNQQDLKDQNEIMMMYMEDSLYAIEHEIEKANRILQNIHKYAYEEGN